MSSNLITGYDTIADFVSGVSKLDLGTRHRRVSCRPIQSDGNSTGVYVEQNPGHFNASTDVAIALVGAQITVRSGDILFS